jgi:hypothetical protein
MPFFLSLFLVAAASSAADANASTDEPSDTCGDQPSDDDRPPTVPRSLGDARALLAGPPREALAFLISALTSPFLVCAAAAGALAIELATSWTEVLVWGAMASIFAGVLPFVIVLVLFLRGRISDMHVAVKEQRWVPLGASMMSGVFGLVALRAVGAPVPLLALTAAYLVNAVIFVVVSFYWKASIHAGVFVGAVAACGLVVDPWWWLGVAGLPAVMWARTLRGRHTVAQGIVGASIALVATVGTYVLTMSLWGS